MADVAFLAVVVVIGGALVVLALRMEPHWCSKDGQRFICRLQPLTRDLSGDGLHKEVRCTVVGDALRISPRGLRGVRLGGTYRITAKSPEPPRGKAVYLASSDGRQVALRVPAGSRCVPELDRLLGIRGVTASP